MWWALAAAAVPYVVQAFQSDPWQPNKPPPVMPADRSYENHLLLDNAFNPHSELFARASDSVQENINRALAKSGMNGSSGGIASAANAQGTLAAKWLEDQTSRQRMALDAVNGNDLRRAEMLNNINNEQYQYDAARYNRDNARNSSQVAEYGGLASGLMDAYGGYQDSQKRNRLNDAMAQYFASHSYSTPTTGTPGAISASIGNDYSAPYTPGRQYPTPEAY